MENWNGKERRMSGFSKEEMKSITKEALKEWLDGKFTTFGHWAFRSISAMAFAALIYFILKTNGWTHR